MQIQVGAARTGEYQHQYYPDQRGRFGPFGGKFVPESLMPALAELEAAYEESLLDAQFQAELREYQRNWTPRVSVPRDLA